MAVMKRESIVTALVDGLAGIRKLNGYWNDITTKNVSRRQVSIDQLDGATNPSVVVTTTREVPHTGTPKPLGVTTGYNELELDVTGFAKGTNPAQTDTMIERLLYDLRRRVGELGGEGCNAIAYEIAEIVTDAQLEGHPEWGVVIMRVIYTYESNPKDP